MVPERAPRARMLRLALGVAALTGRSSAFLIAPALSRPTTHAPHTLMCDGSGTHGGHRQTHADEGEATPLEEVKVVGFSELGALDLTPATLADPDTPPRLCNLFFAFPIVFAVVSAGSLSRVRLLEARERQGSREGEGWRRQTDQARAQVRPPARSTPTRRQPPAASRT